MTAWAVLDVVLLCRWRRRLAKKYYDKLFKEYALADLKHYKDGRIGFRWRTEQEVRAEAGQCSEVECITLVCLRTHQVLEGKGQFVCGNKRCSARTGREDVVIASWMAALKPLCALQNFGVMR